MASFIFDGSASVTAAKADNVFITANPALFVSEAQVGSNVVLTYSNGNTITVTGTTLGDNTTNLPGVSLANGTFATGANVDAVTAGQNGLFFNGTNAIATAPLTGTGAYTANSVHAIFGGLGRSDSVDGADSIQIGGKGSFLVYGNAGADIISQGVAGTGTVATGGNAFDSTSFVTVFGGKNDLGNDSILLANTSNSGAKMAIYGGEGTDSINIFNTGTSANTAIFGGQGAADSTDLADSIAFNGGGTVSIFANAGNDVVTLGNFGAAGNGLDSTANVTVHGGIGSDNIAIKVNNVAATVVAYGDENTPGTANADSISVTGTTGTTVIYGGTAAADSNDNADVITYSGQGTATIYAGGGDDSVVINTTGTFIDAAGTATANNGAAATASSSSNTTVFLGNGNDSINILNTGNGLTAATGTQTVTGGAGSDTFTIGSNTNSATATVSAQGSGTGITITDFTVGVDVLKVNNGTTAAATVTVSNVAAGGSLQQALDLAANNATGNAANGTAAAGTVSVVAFNGDTYVVVSNDTASGFQANSDLAIKLTGVTDAATVAANIVVV
ncbi:beta strand repeat-containing protein [Methylobacterium sp. J-090]|uniref:beta strand repeat-containing protein n=1 Tax=Methylobacterium sp. J-090 TaxID=2836666 RepID=UPI001FB8C78F|nr:hypothetical protein [Methylobacterium sp. J-090]MCJ2082795.1 hypothetical protein [Methylobacterium sp. J-090]